MQMKRYQVSLTKYELYVDAHGFGPTHDGNFIVFMRGNEAVISFALDAIISIQDTAISRVINPEPDAE